MSEYFKKSEAKEELKELKKQGIKATAKEVGYNQYKIIPTKETLKQSKKGKSKKKKGIKTGKLLYKPKGKSMIKPISAEKTITKGTGEMKMVKEGKEGFFNFQDEYKNKKEEFLGRYSL